MPLFVSHLILLLISTAAWVLCIPRATGARRNRRRLRVAHRRATRPPAARASLARAPPNRPPLRRILHDDWPTHIHAWVVFELGLAVLESAFGIWGAIIDARDSTFYERRTETFLLLDIVLLVMNLATSVTGAVYWRHGSDESKILFDCVVILSWIALGVLAVTTAQDKVKSGSD